MADDLQSVTAEVLAADDRRLAATVAGDLEALREVLAEDFTYIHNTGFREGREPYIERFRTGGAKITGMRRLAASVRRVGDTVLVDGEGSMHFRMPAEAPEASFVALYLAVWAKDGGQWRLRAYASTLKTQ